MRENWLATKRIELSDKQLTELIQPVFPGQSVLSSSFAEGGLANTNIKLNLSKKEAPILLRILVRDPAQASKELRLQTLLKGRVPVPELFYCAATNVFSDQPYFLMEWIEGVRLESLIKSISAEEIASYGFSLGKTLAQIHSFHFSYTGFFDENLNVTTFADMGGGGLMQFARRCLSQDNAEKLGVELAASTLDFLKDQSSLLDGYTAVPCLTHSDFGGSNILVCAGSPYVVKAVLDWEFAFSGTPFFDTGNLLRPPLGDNGMFVDSFVRGYTEGGGELPKDWRRISLLTDLTAWLDFLTRAADGSRLLEDVRTVIARTIKSFD